MSIFELWLLTTVIPGLGKLSVLAFVLTAATFAVATGARFLADSGYDEESKKTGEKVSKALLIPVIVLGLLVPLFPSERQMLLIAGGYTATNNAEIKKLPTNAAKAVNAWLDAVTEAAEVEKPAKK